ncbi:MAG TPA: hypothetical protein VNF69_11305 [Burkholderiales bacterium]|nr:hypothetical protein [Burkholderiales bacterium]
MQPAIRDRRDAQESAEVAALLAVLTSGHPAREACARGADTIALTHLLADRPDLVEALKQAFLAGYARLLEGSGGFRPF